MKKFFFFKSLFFMSTTVIITYYYHNTIKSLEYKYAVTKNERDKYYDLSNKLAEELLKSI